MNGLVPIRFTAAGQPSLAGAVLQRNGAVVAEMPLSGTQTLATIGTYDYVPGSQTDSWALTVYDSAGNYASAPFSIVPAAGSNRAPIPYLKVKRRFVTVGETVTLDATRSSDPDGSAASLRVEWDLNGDGRWDTRASTIKTYSTIYRTPGVYRLSARLTDSQGAQAKSRPFGIRVESGEVNNLVTLSLSPSPLVYSTDVYGCPTGYQFKVDAVALLRNTSLRVLTQLRFEVRDVTGTILVRAADAWVEEGEFFSLPKTGGYSDGSLSRNETFQMPLTVCIESGQLASGFLSLHGVAR